MPLSRLGDVDAATRSRAAELAAALTRGTGKRLTRIWGKGGPPEHSTGRALDLMLYIAPGDRIDTAAGDWLADYLWEHRARLGVRHLIWRQRIRSTVVSPGVWRSMASRGSITDDHYDHIHVLFNAIPYAATTASKPPVSQPKPTPGGPFMALTDKQQDDLYNRVMGSIPAGSAEDRYNPDGSRARILDSGDGDYLRVTIEAQTAAIKALAATQGADPDVIEAAVRESVTAALADLRIVGSGS